MSEVQRHSRRRFLSMTATGLAAAVTGALTRITKPSIALPLPRPKPTVFF